MTATNHALTGVAIVVAVGSAWALPLAFAAHFVMDAIPHFDVGPDHSKAARNFAFSDVAVAGVLSIFMALWLGNIAPTWLILAGAFLCAVPDAVWGWRYYLRRDYKKLLAEPMSAFTRWHLKIQWSETHQGSVVEAFWLAFLLTYLITRR